MEAQQEEQEQQQQQHVVFFTHNEHSHIVPMLAMARILGRRGLRATIAIPASTYPFYSNSPSSSDQSDPSDALLHLEAVEESPQHASNELLLLQLKLEEGLVRLMQRLRPPPSILIADIMYFNWAQGVARRFGTRYFLVFPFYATVLLLACYIPDLLQKGFLPFQEGMSDEIIDFIPGLMKGFRVRDIPLELLRYGSAELEAMDYLRHCRASAGVIMCNTAEVIPSEREALDALRSLGLQLYAVAPILQMDSSSRATSRFTEDETCISWLNEQPISSVVYVSFGSIIPLTRQEVEELALGLQACGQPFLWVIRRVEGCSDAVSALPPGFLEQTGHRCCVVTWAPQIAVLSHPSVGCYITHCGCASVFEAIWAEVPMIGCFHKISDQNTMIRVLADACRVALPSMQVPLHDLSGLRNSIEAAIKELLHGQEVGPAIRQQIVCLKAALQEAMASNGSSQRNMDAFVQRLLSSIHDLKEHKTAQ